MTGLPRPLDEYLSSVRDLDQATFLQRSAPYLLLIQTPGVADLDQVTSAAGGLVSGGRELVVVPVAKRAGANTSTDMITVGRTPSSDVCLTNPGVSKFHAYFVYQSRAIYLVDANSLRGTFYGDHRLSPNSRLPLHSGAAVAFGPLKGTILSAKDFYELRVAPS